MTDCQPGIGTDNAKGYFGTAENAWLLPELFNRTHTESARENADNKEPLLAVLDGTNAERNDHDGDTEFDGFAFIRHSAPFGLLSEGGLKFVCYVREASGASRGLWTSSACRVPGSEI
jgi:hypothetical protein